MRCVHKPATQPACLLVCITLLANKTQNSGFLALCTLYIVQHSTKECEVTNTALAGIPYLRKEREPILEKLHYFNGIRGIDQVQKLRSPKYNKQGSEPSREE
jgi:hypothetical protein